MTKGYASTTPEVVFEVRSPTDRWSDLLRKTAEYLTAGVPAVCLVDCDARSITVYRQKGAAKTFEEGASLVLPEVDAEFRVKVARFFEDA